MAVTLLSVVEFLSVTSFQNVVNLLLSRLHVCQKVALLLNSHCLCSSEWYMQEGMFLALMGAVFANMMMSSPRCHSVFGVFII